MSLLFELDDNEEEEYREFYKEHQAKHGDSGAIGGRYEFIVTPTSIGRYIELKCNACGKKIVLREIN